MPIAGRLPSNIQAVHQVPRSLSQAGACITTKNPDLFFSDDLADIAAAKKICAGCNIAAACFAYAATSEKYGVWGNTSSEEREAAAGLPILTPEERREATSIRDAILSGMKTSDIARRFCVSDRTIYRYKKKLKNEGLLAA
jgi:hypothetical protein